LKIFLRNGDWHGGIEAKKEEEEEDERNDEKRKRSCLSRKNIMSKSVGQPFSEV
jgi:hypothetical protein